MSFAAIELSRELYKLTGWEGNNWHCVRKKSESNASNPESTGWRLREGDLSQQPLFVNDGYEMVPAYDCKYLLDKLPATLNLGKPTVCDLYISEAPDVFIANYKYRVPTGRGEWLHMYDAAKLVEATSPEDALCKLAIELAKAGLV